MATGQSLRRLPSNDLTCVAFRLLQRWSLLTEEEHKQLSKLGAVFENMGYEAETGMPAITQWMRPADEMYPQGIRPATN